MIKSLLFYAVLLLLTFNAHCQDQINDIKSLIKTKYPGEVPRDITLLGRIDMGIPDGDNWLVEWKYKDIGDTYVEVYTINGEEVIEKIVTSNFDPRECTDFDIMRDIPGMRVGEGSCVVYDYNGDGYDDIFNYAFWGRGFFILIIGYDPENNEKVYYCHDVPFSIVDKKNGPAPVEFIIYKGMKGFKVYYDLSLGEPKHPPKNIIDKTYAWYFFSWDEGMRKFVEIEEVEEDGIESLWFVDVKEIQVQIIEIKETVSQETEEKNPQSVIDTKNQTETVVENDAEEGSMPLWALVAIIGGVVAIAGSTALFVVKRRK